MRTYRLGPAGHAPSSLSRRWRPAISGPRLPSSRCEARSSNEPEHAVIGEIIADGVIQNYPAVRTSALFRGCPPRHFVDRARALMPAVENHLGASFILSGNLASGSTILISAEPADARKNEVVWMERLSGATQDLLRGAKPRAAGPYCCVGKQDAD